LESGSAAQPEQYGPGTPLRDPICSTSTLDSPLNSGTLYPKRAMASQQAIELEGKVARKQKAKTTGLSISGMSCGNCARHVSEAIQSVPGVRSATVNLDGHRAMVQWQGQSVDIDAVVKAVEAQGYGAKVLEAAEADHETHKLAGWRLNLAVGLPVTAVLMLGEWALGLGMRTWFEWLSFVLAALVQVFAGARFYRGAWSQLKVGSSNMDTLVALGSTTAFVYSTWALLARYGGHLYFMEAAAILTLISLGHWAESRVSVRASSALRQLLNLAPALARRVESDGSETEVPVAELTVSEQVCLRPGDHVPVDGVVVSGSSAVDESMLTGESAPVDKSANDDVYAGTVNLNGRLIMRVTATGEATALAHIIAAVQRAQNSRASIQRIGDRVSSVFVPVVIAVAIAAGFWWGFAPESAHRVHSWIAQFGGAGHLLPESTGGGFIIAAAVLIVACPCAMGLATPAAIMAGSNAAAQRGILIRDGVALEKAGRVTALLFDKTGTLTVGRPSVVKIWEAEGSTFNSEVETPQEKLNRETKGLHLNSVLQFGVALAQPSNHPLSQAIARIGADKVEISNWREIHGAGVTGEISNPRSQTDSPYSTVQSAQSKTRSQQSMVARMGSLRWLRETGVNLNAGEAFIKEWSGQGASIIGVALESALVGLFALKDTVKPGSKEVVRTLQGQGLKIFLVTGDSAVTAASIARQIGIPPDNAFAEVRPERKAEMVRRLQAEGERVAFVGDGINDAPALEQADLGIAVARASDIAREAADIILLKSEIEAVPESLGLARATLATIKQNLFWAFFYNVLAIPLAALGFMSPILCAAAMGLSDLVVIGNALRLRRWKMRKIQT